MDDLVRLLDLLGADGAAVDADPPLAIATVVNTRGSAYRRPGARMLIRQSMAVQGAVSAGCLERDIIAHCEALKAGDKPLLLTYDGNSSDELIFGLRLGCDGIVQILLEPVGPGTNLLPDGLPDGLANGLPDFYRLKALVPQLLSNHRRLVAVTVFELTGPASVDVDTMQDFDQATLSSGVGLVMLEAGLEGAGGQKYHLDGLPGPVSNLLRVEALQALHDDQGRSFVVKHEVDGYCCSALIEVVQSITSLGVFGSGQDVGPLVDMAHVLGWRITVLNNTQIDRLLNDQCAALIDGQNLDAAIVMTHDYDRDKKILQGLFASWDLPYIGVVGPRRRSDKLLAELALKGVPVTEDQLSRLYSPVGLDLGAERPEEIALSILAEIKAVLAGHRGGFLREKQGPIHAPIRLKTFAGDESSAPPGTRAVRYLSLGTTCRVEDV